MSFIDDDSGSFVRRLGSQESFEESFLEVRRMSSVAEEGAAGAVKVAAEEAKLSKFGKFKKGAKEGLGAIKILILGIGALGVLELLNGLGKPDSGVDFTNGANDFDTLEDMLAKALPASVDWSGDAATSYKDAVNTLKGLASDMNGYDVLMQTYVQEQAERVTQTREQIEHCIEACAAAIPVALALYAIPVARRFSKPFQIATVAATLTTAIGVAGKTATEANSTASDMKIVEGDYSDVATKAGTVDTGTKNYEVPGASAGQSKWSSLRQGSAGSSFEASSDSGSGLSMSDVAGLTSRRASTDRGALLGASSGVGESSASTAADYVSERLGTDTDDDTPRFTLSQGPVETLTNEVSAIEGNLSQNVNLLNQMMGEVQQLGSMAPQGQPPAPPAAPVPAEQAAAKEDAVAGATPEDTLVDNVEGAGAALGTEATGRAPIDNTTVGPQQQQPNPGGRVL